MAKPQNDSSRKTNSSEGGEKAIIQCPSCTTRFAIDPKLLELAEAPRFHCSRCDNVFAHEAKAKPQLTQVKSEVKVEQVKIEQIKAEPKAPSKNDFDEIPKREPLSAPASSASQQPLITSAARTEFSTPVQKVEPQVTSTLPSTKPSEPPSWSSSAGFSGGLKIPTSLDIKAKSVDPHEPANRSSRGMSHGSMSQGSTEPTQMNLALSAGEKLAREPFKASVSELISEPVISGRSEPREERTSGRSALSTLAAAAQSVTRTTSLRAIRLDSISSVFSRPMALYLYLPIVGLLGALATITIFSMGSPTTTAKIILGMAPAAPRIAPSGVHIAKSSFDRVVLDSGETVYVISGELANSTDARYSDVQIEGQVFDREGNMIARSTAGAGSSLGSTRVKSLSVDMIRNIQETKQPGNFQLSSGEKHEFAVALTDSDLNNAAYYSARIFSVREGL